MAGDQRGGAFVAGYHGFVAGDHGFVAGDRAGVLSGKTKKIDDDVQNSED